MGSTIVLSEFSALEAKMQCFGIKKGLVLFGLVGLFLIGCGSTPPKDGDARKDMEQRRDSTFKEL